MAVRKDELQNYLTEAQKNEADAVEASVDAYLKEHYQGRLIYCAIPGTRSKVADEVMRRYREAWWVVEFFSDQRDGDSLKFE